LEDINSRAKGENIHHGMIKKAKLAPYGFWIDPERPDAILIMQTFGNQVVGQVWLFRSREEMQDKIDNTEHYITIDGYRILVAYDGCVSPSHSGTGGIDNALMKMAELYYNERISKKPNYFKRYKKSE
jgi:hypothetical protein